MVGTPRNIRVGKHFYDVKNRIKAQSGIRIADEAFTDGLAQFLEEEQLVDLLAKRAAKRARRGPFG